MTNRDDVLRILDSVEWERTRWQMGSSAGFVPGAFRRMIDAHTQADADAAYWRLDNGVVVQGSLFEGAEKLVPSLLAALELDLSPPARHRVVELLAEIALGVPDSSEVAIGNSRVAEDARASIRSGIEAVYTLLGDRDRRVRAAALHILDAVELDRRRLASAAVALARADPDEEVREYARENLDEARPRFHERRTLGER